MKSENKVSLKVGDVVKSLDFVTDPTCYYVGRVCRILDDGRFVADTMERVWNGESVLDPDCVSSTFTAPMPGTMLMDDLGDRITVIA